ncbi:hypothetical protein [Tuwongella immobilis]|uniref:hypothetical protein n=1 Tax=Tuwongella immobilis TaxID=692036 RepID=UPI0013A6E922|nr:hypothetical protein [Tuwongella immobilis]
MVMGFAVICWLAAFVVVPMVINWLRHRPHRLTQGTQHLVAIGLGLQFLLLALAILLFRWG